MHPLGAEPRSDQPQPHPLCEEVTRRTERQPSSTPYAIDADAQKVFGWTAGFDGELVAIGAFEGVPETVAGLAAS